LNPLFPLIIFFMIIIRGLLIIINYFWYFSRLVSNENNLNAIKKSTVITNIIINPLYIILIFYLANLLTLSHQSNTYTNIITLNYSRIKSLIIYSYISPFIDVSVICIIFLLIALISVIKICVPKIKTLPKNYSISI